MMLASRGLSTPPSDPPIGGFSCPCPQSGAPNSWIRRQSIQPAVHSYNFVSPHWAYQDRYSPSPPVFWFFLFCVGVCCYPGLLSKVWGPRVRAGWCARVAGASSWSQNDAGSYGAPGPAWLLCIFVCLSILLLADDCRQWILRQWG